MIGVGVVIGASILVGAGIVKDRVGVVEGRAGVVRTSVGRAGMGRASMSGVGKILVRADVVGLETRRKSQPAQISPTRLR